MRWKYVGRILTGISTIQWIRMLSQIDQSMTESFVLSSRSAFDQSILLLVLILSWIDIDQTVYCDDGALRLVPDSFN